MQEEVEQRIVSLMISCGKLGEQEFRKAVAKLLEQLKNCLLYTSDAADE